MPAVSTASDISTPNREANAKSSAKRTAWRQFRRDRTATLSAAVLLLIIISVIFGPRLYPVPYDAIDFAKSTATGHF